MHLPVYFSICDSSATNQMPSVGKTLLTRVETSSAHCWPLHQQLVFLITMVKGQCGLGSPTLPHEENAFTFVQGGYSIWCCLCSALSASDTALSSVSEILITLCGGDLLAAFFSGESTAMPQCLKLGLTVPFKRGFSAHPIGDCTTPIYAVAWVEGGNWDFCIKHWYCSHCPSICGSELNPGIVCFSILCHFCMCEGMNERDTERLQL